MEERPRAFLWEVRELKRGEKSISVIKSMDWADLQFIIQSSEEIF